MSILIPRSVWKPQYANGFRIIGTSEWEAAGKETWLHHSVTAAPGPGATLEQDCAHMRHIESIGQNAYGGGISYTAIVMPSGRAFEGHSLDRQGSHTYQRNNRARAICLAGNYDSVVPNAKMLGTVALVLREWGCELDGGHRDVFQTACPGQYAYARIGSINEAARSGVPIEGEDVNDQQNAYLTEVWRATAENAKLHSHVNFLGDLINSKTAELEEKIEAIGTPTLTPENIAAIRSGLANEIADLLAERLKS